MDLSASNRNWRLSVLLEIKMLKSATGCKRFTVSVYISRPKLLSFFCRASFERFSETHSIKHLFVFIWHSDIYATAHNNWKWTFNEGPTLTSFGGTWIENKNGGGIPGWRHFNSGIRDSGTRDKNTSAGAGFADFEIRFVRKFKNWRWDAWWKIKIYNLRMLHGDQRL